MQSVRFHEFGDPADVLRVEDVPQPEPGADQVLVRLRARSINPSDLLTVRGLYGALPQKLRSRRDQKRTIRGAGTRQAPLETRESPVACHYADKQR